MKRILNIILINIMSAIAHYITELYYSVILLFLQSEKFYWPFLDMNYYLALCTLN